MNPPIVAYAYMGQINQIITNDLVNFKKKVIDRPSKTQLKYQRECDLGRYSAVYHILRFCYNLN